MILGNIITKYENKIESVNDRIIFYNNLIAKIKQDKSSNLKKENEQLIKRIDFLEDYVNNLLARRV